MPADRCPCEGCRALRAWGEARRLMRDAPAATSAASYVADGKARRTLADLADRLAREGSGACAECHGSGTVMGVSRPIRCDKCGGGRAGR